MICNYTDFFPIAINPLSLQKVKYYLAYDDRIVFPIYYTCLDFPIYYEIGMQIAMNKVSSILNFVFILDR